MIKVLFITLLISLNAQAAGDGKGDYHICNQLLHLANTNVVESELKATFAELFTQDYPVFYSGGFRQLVLSEMKKQFYQWGSGFRDVLRDIKINRSGYATDLEEVSGRVLDQLESHFAYLEPGPLTKRYSIKGDDVPSVKNILLSIQSNSKLKLVMRDLINDIIYYSLDNTITLSRKIWFDKGHLGQIRNGLRDIGPFAYVAAPFVLVTNPQLYCYLGYCTRYEVTKNGVMKKAVSASSGDGKAIDLKELNFGADSDVLANQSSYESLNLQVSQAPSASELNIIEGAVKYDLPLQKAIHEIKLMGLTASEAFMDDDFWESLDRAFKNVSDLSELRDSDRVAMSLSVNGIKTHVERYRKELLKQYVVLSEAQKTIITMIGALQAAVPVGESSEQSRALSRVQGLQNEIDAMLESVGSLMIRMDAASQEVEKMEVALNPFQGQKLGQKDLKESLKLLKSLR